jgi:hypothetical protein
MRPLRLLDHHHRALWRVLAAVPVPLGISPTHPAQSNTFSIAVQFTGPTQPVPGYFTGTLAVIGAGTTATMTLVATTARISPPRATVIGADGVFAPPHQNLPDGTDVIFEGPFVMVLIDCAYGDPNPLKLQVVLESQSPPKLLSISSPQTISVPQPLGKVVNPRMPQWDFWGPLPDRVGKVTLLASVNPPAVSGSGTVSINVTTPDFPWLTNTPLTIEVPYKLQIKR